MSSTLARFGATTQLLSSPSHPKKRLADRVVTDDFHILGIWIQGLPEIGVFPLVTGYARKQQAGRVHCPRRLDDQYLAELITYIILADVLWAHHLYPWLSKSRSVRWILLFQPRQRLFAKILVHLGPYQADLRRIEVFREQQ